MVKHVLKIKNFVFKISPFLKKYIAYNRFRRDKWIAKESIKIDNNSNVLDIGAGGCPYRSNFNHTNYKTHDFVQLNPNQIQQIGYGKIDYVSDILEIPVDNASFDAVICTEVIEHVPYPIEVIKEISRLLKKNGVLLITAPLQSGLHQEPFHFYGGFTKYWYSKFLTENGFKIIEIIPNGSIFTTLISNLFTLVKQCFEYLIQGKLFIKLVSFLLLIFLLPLSLMLLIPLHICENLFQDYGFTSGYHVKAIKI